MKRVLRGLIIGFVAFSIGFGSAAIFNRLMIRYLMSKGIEALAEAQKVEVPNDATEDKTLNVSVCDLKNDPAKYNHSLVKLTGYFSRGFEDSNLYDPTCKSNQFIWVDIGGKRSINVMYCCGFTPKPYREQELEVEGIKLPLTEDAIFNQYDNALAKGKNVKATVIGTFFSGEKVKYPGGTFYSGYGHMGIGSLFIVQQVLTSEVSNIKNK